MRSRGNIPLIIILSFLSFIYTVYPISGLEKRPYPVIATDAINDRISVHSKPKRVISVNPSATEILYAIGAKDAVIGVTQYCPFPEISGKKANVGTVLDPDVERIISLKPDIVFATIDGNRKNRVMAIKDAGVKVFVTDRVSNFDELYAQVLLLGRLIGEEKNAEDLVRHMKSRMKDVKNKISNLKKKPNVFLQLNPDPIMTVNKDVILNEIIELAGGINIARDARIRYPIYSLESVVAQNPDVIIIVSMGENTEAAANKWNKYKTLSAVRNKRIYVIDSDLLCNMGPRLCDAVEYIAKLLYPEFTYVRINDVISTEILF